MTTGNTEKEGNGFWAIVEIMGHKRYAGHVSEEVMGGASFVRVDVPANGEALPDPPPATWSVSPAARCGSGREASARSRIQLGGFC